MVVGVVGLVMAEIVVVVVVVEIGDRAVVSNFTFAMDSTLTIFGMNGATGAGVVGGDDAA